MGSPQARPSQTQGMSEPGNETPNRSLLFHFLSTKYLMTLTRPDRGLEGNVEIYLSHLNMKLIDEFRGIGALTERVCHPPFGCYRPQFKAIILNVSFQLPWRICEDSGKLTHCSGNLNWRECYPFKGWLLLFGSCFLLESVN